MTKHTELLPLWPIGRQAFAAAFDAEHTTSDAGVVLLGRIDRQLRLTERLAAAIHDRREPAKIRHTTRELLLQRICQIALGWPGCNDAATLRHDPAYKLACDRQPVSGADLASQPTLSRLENRITPQELDQLSQVLLDVTLDKRAKTGTRRRTIILDFDGTDAQTHGHQQLSFFHGYYGHTCYLPLLIFDGDTGDLLSVMMRSGKAGTAEGTVTQLAEIVAGLKRRWPGARIILRGDAGFAWPEVFEFAETYGLDYLIAMGSNVNLAKLSEFAETDARRLAERAGESRRRYGMGQYQSQGWEAPRTVIWKAEAQKADAAAEVAMDVRFVVTNLYGEANVLYDRYCQRGDAENRIKDFKRALAGDRMSCHQVTANHFRPLLHAAAYLLMQTLRGHLADTDAGRWQFDTLRLRLLKVGGWLQQSVRRVVLHLAASHPRQDLWRLLFQRLAPT